MKIDRSGLLFIAALLIVGMGVMAHAAPRFHCKGVVGKKGCTCVEAQYSKAIIGYQRFINVTCINNEDMSVAYFTFEESATAGRYTASGGLVQ